MRVYGSFITKTNARATADTVLRIIAQKHSSSQKPEKKVGAISLASVEVARDRDKDGLVLGHLDEEADMAV